MTKEPFHWVNDNVRLFMSRGYLVDGQSVEGRVADISDAFQDRLVEMGLAPNLATELGSKFYQYMGAGFYSLASPEWSNYGNPRGYPVSCFGAVPHDSMSLIGKAVHEGMMLMKGGGGHSLYMGDTRPRGALIQGGANGKSSGSVHFLQIFETLTNVVSQGSTRRGFISPYHDVEHPDIEEFLEIGSEGNLIQDLTTGVVVGDEFMEKARGGDAEARSLLAKIHKSRSEVGYPYILFRDNANRQKPDVYHEARMDIKASNMCSEIMLPSSEDETFVCVLASMNLAEYDAWKDTDAVEVLTIYLDTVVEEFIQKLEGDEGVYNPMHPLHRVWRFAQRHRALGLGVLGLHHLYQSKGLPFDSREANRLNLEVFKVLQERTQKASVQLAEWFGEPTLLKGYGRRNSTLMAIAPTKSSSFILGQTSQSIEPEFANTYTKNLAKLKVVIRNPYLEEVLEGYGKNDEATWKIIEENAGSVQTLDFLTDHEKDVFKTFHEINPEALIYQAAIRQEYIDQGQSLNLIIPPDMPVKEINRLVYLAWELGIKSLYYQYSMNSAQMLTRERLSLESGCKGCEG